MFGVAVAGAVGTADGIAIESGVAVGVGAGVESGFEVEVEYEYLAGVGYEVEGGSANPSSCLRRRSTLSFATTAPPSR